MILLFGVSVLGFPSGWDQSAALSLPKWEWRLKPITLIFFNFRNFHPPLSPFKGGGFCCSG
jgi:hypothetical protein